MSDDNEPVTFTVVGSHPSSETRPDRQTQPPSGDAGRALPFRDQDGQAALPFDRRDDDLGEDRFPLAGPIVDSATSRRLKGKCSRCDSKLRLKLREEGPVRVRCPICGHARTIDL